MKMNGWLGSFVDEIMTFSVFSYCLPLLMTPVDDDNDDAADDGDVVNDAVASAAAYNEVIYLLVLLFFVPAIR